MDKVIFCGRTTAENCGPWPGWAVISITDPGAGKIHFEPGWHDVLCLSFHDAEKDEKPYVLMTERDAFRIVEFVHRVAPNLDGIMVHCKGGISRSGAVAKWIAETYNLRFSKHYSEFNQYVYSQLGRAYGQWRRSHG